MAWGFELPDTQGGSAADLSRITDLFRSVQTPALSAGISTSRGLTPMDWWMALAAQQAQAPGSPATPTRPSVSSQYTTQIPGAASSSSPSAAPALPSRPTVPFLGQTVPDQAQTPLPSYPIPTLPPYGGTIRGLPPQGMGTSGGPTTTDPLQVNWGALASGVAPLLLALFGNNPYQEKAASSAADLQALAQSLGKEGHQIAGQGLEALGPVLQYLTALAGGNPQALAEATQPERARVLDQYDSARKALQFLPRGGGQAGAVMQAGSKAAGDIGSLVADARRSAAGTLGGLGRGLLQEGITEERTAADALTQAINAYVSLGAQRGSSLGQFGWALGGALEKIIPALLVAGA